jgi:hypothetical protein
LLLRTFNNKKSDEIFFETTIQDITGKIYFIDEREVRRLFEQYFEIEDTHESKPAFLKEYVFDEYLLRARGIDTEG